MLATRPGLIRKFQAELLAWFDAHARDLPWRRSAEPYHIWISEIMLQQTRVNAVLEHYARFLRLFPTVRALAEAKEPDVLAAWSGLGYYRRARMMHKAAQVVVEEHGGELPSTAEGLRGLPGIGEYTSSAIASIAFGQPVAVVDGNVERVLLRVFPQAEAPAGGMAEAKALRGRAGSLLDRQRPGDFNQAMMELGAMVCLPQRPLCLNCPVHAFCPTRGEHPSTPAKAMLNRDIAYALMRRTQKGELQVRLEQRSASSSLMPGMWELPEVAMQENDLDRVAITVRHSITVTNYRVQILALSEREATERLAAQGQARKWVTVAELEKLPLTGLARKVLTRLEIMPKFARYA